MNAMLETGWLLVAILAPLWVNLWAAQPFDPSKTLLVRAVVWPMAGLVAVDALVHPRHSLPARLSVMRPFTFSISALAAAIVAATIFSVDRRLSLYGSYDRAQGALALLSYPALAAIVAARMRDPVQARRLVTALVATGVPLVVLGAAQAVGWQPFPLVTDARSPVYATLGRSNFLGAYLALLLPLTLMLRRLIGGEWQRRLLALLVAVEGIVLVLAQSRGAWLAAVIALAVLGWMRWQSRIPARWWRVGWVGMGLATLIGPLAVVWLGRSAQGSPAARWAIWRATWHLICQRPWLGYGPDTLGLIFPRVFPPELVYFQGRDFFVDRAHNLFLDWAVTTGVPGLAAYLAVLIVVGAMIVRGLRRSDDTGRRILLTGALAALVGQFANNLVSFDVTATATASWLLVGMAVALAAHGEVEVGAAAVRARCPWRWAVAGIVVVATLAANAQFVVRPLLADVAARTAARYANDGQWSRAVAAGEQAVRLSPYEPAYHVGLSRRAWQVAVLRQDMLRLQQTGGALLSALRLSPGDFTIWAALGDFYARAHWVFGADTMALAHQAYEQAVTLAPNHATVYAAWGQVYLREGDVAMAATLLRRAVILDGTSAEAYRHLGAAEMALGRVPEAQAAYREALRLDPHRSDPYSPGGK